MDTPTDYLAMSWGWDRTQPLWASSAPTRRTPRRSRSSRGPSPWACCPCRPGRSCQGPSPRSRPARSRSGWPPPPAQEAAPAPSEDKNMWIGEIYHHISYVPGRPAAVCGWVTGGQQSVGPVWRSAESSWCGLAELFCQLCRLFHSPELWQIIQDVHIVDSRYLLSRYYEILTSNPSITNETKNGSIATRSTMFMAFFMNFIFLGHTINLRVSIQKI